MVLREAPAIDLGLAESFCSSGLRFWLWCIVPFVANTRTIGYMGIFLRFWAFPYSIYLTGTILMCMFGVGQFRVVARRVSLNIWRSLEEGVTAAGRPPLLLLPIGCIDPGTSLAILRRVTRLKIFEPHPALNVQR